MSKRLYENILEKYPSFFTDKDIKEITEMLAPEEKDNAYLTLLVMEPYLGEIKDDIWKRRASRSKYLIFKDEAANPEGAFSRQDESAANRMGFFIDCMTNSLSILFLLLGEWQVRMRKGLVKTEGERKGIEEISSSVHKLTEASKAEDADPADKAIGEIVEYGLNNQSIGWWFP